MMTGDVRYISAIPLLLTSALRLAGSPPLTAAETSPTILGISGARFTINGEPKFLLGVSYYGGLGASKETIVSDLDQLQRAGFNWLRIWGTWESRGENISAVDADGNPRQPFLSKLQWIVAECDRRQVIVDVTLARGRRSERMPHSMHLPNLAAHRQAVRTLIAALKPHRNWYLDLANERDVRDERFVSVDELRSLRKLADGLEPTLPVTASFGGHDLSSDDVRDALDTARLDFLSVHRPRTPDSSTQTAAQTRQLLATASQLGFTVPVHHQEPFRRGYGNWQPATSDFLTDLRGAIEGGAAGWCFHNGDQRPAPEKLPQRSFDLRGQTLFEQLDEEELEFLNRVDRQSPALPGDSPQLRHHE